MSELPPQLLRPRLTAPVRFCAGLGHGQQEGPSQVRSVEPEACIQGIVA